MFDHFVGLALERSNCIFRYFHRIQRGINNKLEGILIIRFNFADLFAAILTSSNLENNSQNIPKKLWRTAARNFIHRIYHTHFRGNFLKFLRKLSLVHLFNTPLWFQNFAISRGKTWCM